MTVQEAREITHNALNGREDFGPMIEKVMEHIDTAAKNGKFECRIITLCGRNAIEIAERLKFRGFRAELTQGGVYCNWQL